MQHRPSTYQFVLSGGGTGGHIFPAIALANALKKRCGNKATFMFIGAKGKIEAELVPQAGFPIKTLKVIGMPRNRNPFRLFTFAVKTLIALASVRSILKKLRPSAVIGFGGYASFPTLYMAQKMKLPNFIHEQNAFCGIVNKALAKNTTTLFGGYKELEENLPPCQFQYVGNPVREELINLHQIDAKSIKEKWGLSQTKKTILITGGSQGALNMNKKLIAILPSLPKLDVQIIWQTGLPSKTLVEEAAKKNNANVHAESFFHRMQDAYATADIIIARAGAITIAELAVVGKPTILIPLPYAAENHQLHNAQVLEKDKATILIEEQNIESQLTEALEKVINNTIYATQLSSAIKKKSVTNAADHIAKKILNQVKAC